MSNFKSEVYKIVAKIPKGKVATYGQIALIFRKQTRFGGHLQTGFGARLVGNALHANRDPKVPCHRVVDRNGRLAPNFAGPHWPRAKAIGRRAFDGAIEQRRRLVAEGVKFSDNTHVDLSKYLWKEKCSILT